QESAVARVHTPGLRAFTGAADGRQRLCRSDGEFFTTRPACCGRWANRQKAPSPRTVIEFARSKAQCEQFDRTDTDHEHCERYGIVVQPIPLGLHDTPPCPALLVAPTGEWFKCDADD